MTFAPSTSWMVRGVRPDSSGSGLEPLEWSAVPAPSPRPSPVGRGIDLQLLTRSGALNRFAGPRPVHGRSGLSQPARSEVLSIVLRSTRCEPGRFAARRLAFTLLEVLLAVAAFGIVLAAINTVYFSALRLRDKTAAAIDEAVPLEQALAVIKRDLANLVAPGGTLSGAFQTSSLSNIVAGQSSPTFCTTSAMIDDTSPWSGIQRVSYLLVDSTNRTGGRDLVRAVTRNLLPPVTQDPPDQRWPLSGVQALAFQYHDGSQWRDSWDSSAADNVTGETNTLPKAIKVQLEMLSAVRGRSQPPPIELVVPIVVHSRTNDVEQAAGGGQ
jgi:type II secretion system protein J